MSASDTANPHPNSDRGSDHRPDPSPDPGSDHRPNPKPSPDDRPDPRLDIRLLAPAAAGWLTAVLLVACNPTTGALTAAISATLAILTTYLVLRSTRRTNQPSAQRAGWALVGVLVVISGMALAAALQVQSLRAGPVQALAADATTVDVHLKITADPAVRRSPGTHRPPYVVLKATVEELRPKSSAHPVRLRTPILVIATERWRDVRYGERIATTGRLEAVNDGDDVAATLTVRTAPTSIGEPAWWLRAAEQVRAGLRASVADEPDDVRGLVPALVMGDESALPDDLIQDFQTTGLTHLSAVSGTNLTLLLVFIVPFARLIGVRAWGLSTVGLFTVVVFVILARPQPSVLRAAAMGLIALIALTAADGGRRAVRSLSVAVIVLLLIDTSLARSAGFALSVLATAGIVLLGPGWRDALANWLPTWLAEAVSCPLAAQLACTPVVAWLSGEVSLVAVAANLLAGPAVAPATILGFTAAGVALISIEAAQLVGWAAGWPARWIILIAREGADLPGAASPWPATAVGVAVLTFLCLIAVLGLHRLLARPLAMLIAVVLLALAVLRPVGSLGWPPRDWLMVMCDVGQGDGIVLRAGDASAVVVDTGPDPAAMDRCLRDLRINHIPIVVLSHFHADHVGGLAGVLNDRRVDELAVTPYFSPPAEHRRVSALAAHHRIPVKPVTYQEKRTIGHLTWTTLWPARVPPSHPQELHLPKAPRKTTPASPSWSPSPASASS